MTTGELAVCGYTEVVTSTVGGLERREEQIMYAMIRRYRMAAGSIDDLMHKVDTQYADRLQEQLGIIHYQAIDTGDRTIATVTVFEDEERWRRSEAAAARVREGLAEFGVEEIGSLAGEVMVSRASERVLRAVHH
jgi:hypothetical protein